jgi:acyl-CoA thioester hydrolase
MSDVIPAHTLELRVYYEDTDAAGIVYHANYLKFAERARTELLRGLGFDHRGLAAGPGIVFAVSRCDIHFAAPARLDDLLTVHTDVIGLGGARLLLLQRICRDGALLVRLEVALALLDRATLRPRRLPESVRQRFAAAIPSS